MKLAREEIIRSADASPLKLFEQGIKAEATRRKYRRTLRRVMCEVLEDVLEGDFEARARQFVQRARDDPGWALDILISISWKLRERTKLPKDDGEYLNPTSVKGYFKPIKKLLDMNGVSASWTRVYATFPEKDNVLDAKGWTRDQISAMLDQAQDQMDKVILLVLASSGVRLGGLSMTWGDLTPVYLEDGRLTTDPGKNAEIACVALNVYAGSPENYTTFATPEAYQTLQKYGKTWAKLMKRQPGPEDPVFLATTLLPRRASGPAIAKRVRRMAAAAGLRDEGDKKGPRFGVQLVHGFRKFFNKTCKEALAGDTIASVTRVEYMMGHRGLVALDQNYFKTDMLEMAAVYVKVAPDLTINDADRLRLSNRMMSDNIRKMEDEKDNKIARLETEVAELKKRGSVPGTDLVAALRDAAGAEGVPGNVVKSLTGMVDQMGKVQEAALREMSEKYDAEIRELRRALGRRDSEARPGRGESGDGGRDYEHY